MPPSSAQPTEVTASKRALSGFFLSGLILSFPGSILPAWGYHLRPHYVSVGNYFLALVPGILAAVRVQRIMQRRYGASSALTLACCVATASFISLSFTAPPVNQLWRLPGLIGLGFAAGVLNPAIFQSISAVYRADRAGTVNLGGIWFGLGSLVSPLLIAGTFNLYSVSWILIFISAIPAIFAIFYWRVHFPPTTVAHQRNTREVLRDFTIPGAVLLSLLLFFHFGNEWAISGWLPLFLILRLGMSPVAALLLLAAYWLALMLGRIVVQWALPRFSQAKLLLGGVLSSLFGCLVLAFTDNTFGAWLGTLTVGLGFAPVYPLVVERIAARFPFYHPGLFNGIFSFALTGGLLAPATLGYAAEYLGIRVVTALPAAGTFIVLILVLGIWLESRIAEWNRAKTD